MYTKYHIGISTATNAILLIIGEIKNEDNNIIIE